LREHFINAWILGIFRYAFQKGKMKMPETTTQKSGFSIKNQKVTPQTMKSTPPERVWHRHKLLWVSLVVLVLLGLTFPLWNPQTLYINELIRDLGDESTRGHAFEVLTQDIGAPAVKALVKAMDFNDDPQIRASAEDALIAMGTPAIEPLVANFLNNSNSGTYSLLLSIGAPAVGPLVAALASHPDRSYDLEAILKYIGLPAVEPLIIAAKEGSPDTRMSVLRILFNNDYCLDTLYDHSLACQPPTGETLTHMNELLFDLLQDSDSTVRASAVLALTGGRWLTESSVPFLIAALGDANWFIRSEAAKALGRMEIVSAVTPLAALLNDENFEVRGTAALALVKIGTPGINALIAAFDGGELVITARDYSQIIEAGDAVSVPVLIAALFSGSNASMAQDYLNCGELRLKEATEVWASQHGYQIEYFNSAQNTGLSWGGGD
jgi:HEAT repeat protein